MGLKEWLISVVDDAAELDNTLPNPYSDNIASAQNQGTKEQEIAKQGLPSHTESSAPPHRNAQPEKLSAYCASELIRAQRENQALRNILCYYFFECEFDLDFWEKLYPLI